MTDELERINQIADPFEQLRAATRRMPEAQREVTELARLRRRLVQELHNQGLSYAQIAEAAGLTRGRIHQLRHAGPRPEGAFLGVGGITILTPLKQEAIQARPVVAVEDVNAANRLAELARTLGLEPETGHIPVGGAVDLNRENLIVICGPRLSEPVAKVLQGDPFIRFERAEDGPWTLRDLTTGVSYRSGVDSDPVRPWDPAYLGRLPRPDGKGSVLVFTGVHPAGTLGVVQLLASEISELYSEVKTDPFSAVIGTEYDDATGEPVAVQIMTPVYKHRES